MKYVKDLVNFALFREPVDKFLKDLDFNRDFLFYLGVILLVILIGTVDLCLQVYFGPLPILSAGGIDTTFLVLFVILFFLVFIPGIVSYFLNCFAIHFFLSALKYKGNLSRTLGAVVKVLSSTQLTYIIPLQIVVLLISIVMAFFYENEAVYPIISNIKIWFYLLAGLILIIPSTYLLMKTVKKLYNTSTIKALAAILFLPAVALIIMVVFLILIAMYFTARPA